MVELRGAHDSYLAAEERAAKKKQCSSFSWLASIEPDFKGGIEHDTPSPRCRLGAAPEGAARPLGHGDHGLNVLARNVVEDTVHLVESLCGANETPSSHD